MGRRVAGNGSLEPMLARIAGLGNVATEHARLELWLSSLQECWMTVAFSRHPCDVRRALSLIGLNKIKEACARIYAGTLGNKSPLSRVGIMREPFLSFHVNLLRAVEVLKGKQSTHNLSTPSLLMPLKDKH